MPEFDKLHKLFLYLGIPIGGLFTFVLIICIALWIYPQFRLLIGDILKAFGRTSKWIRRKSIEAELEGTINLFTKHFNSELSLPLLPDCNVQWVTAKTAKSFMTPGKAIVRLSFGDDHDLNFYNAADSFIKMSLLPKAKPFLNKTAAKAIDLLMVKNLLIKSRRQALDIFNNRFRDEDQVLKERFYQYEETEREGLFKRILLQEYHFLGETIGDKTPSESHQEEAEKFSEWFYDLATRETQEISDLSFRSENINIGVILVADSKTYERFGNEPYLRRANAHASNDCHCIYILSRGSVKGAIVKEIAHDLETTGCFESLTKKAEIRTQMSHEKSLMIVTCIALKPSLPAIIQRAWQLLREAKATGQPLHANIREVSKESVTVDVYGLRVDIENQYLSTLQIDDVRRYFRVNDEISVNVLECSEENNTVLLSNIDTETDPKCLVDEFDDYKDKIVIAYVEKILSVESLGTGIIIKFPEKKLKGYVPRRQATYSRFGDLSVEYTSGKEIRVNIQGFDVDYKTFLCHIADLKDPSEQIDKYAANQVVECTIRQLSKRYIICEIESGLEVTILFDEIVWGTDDQKIASLKRYNVGDRIKIKILDIDSSKRKLYASLKRLINSPVECFYDSNAGKIVRAIVKNISSNFALLTFEEDQIEGYLHVSEFMWNFCNDMTRQLKEGQQLETKVLSYDPSFDNIKVSCKRCIPNNFSEFNKHFKEKDTVKGKVKCIDDDRIIILLSFNTDKHLEGYVHKSELSNICFVDNSIINRILLSNKEYYFVVKRIDKRFQIVELSRKEFLREALNKVDYGSLYKATAICRVHGNLYLHGDVLEGLLIDVVSSSVSLGEEVTVIPARIDQEKAKIELQISE